MLQMMKILILIALMLICVAFLTLLERKILSLIGLRLGPWKPSFMGVMQPMIDAAKISQKQTNSLSNFSFLYYYFSAICMIISSMMLVSIMVISPKPLDLKMSLMFFLFFISIHSVNSLFSGWAIYSKYSILASLRTVSQMVSYEGVMFMVIFFLMFIYGSFELKNFYEMKFLFMLFPLVFLSWVVSVLAELSRTPTDFSESESELVSGFNIDFGSKFFSILFISEYTNILFFCFLTSFMFLFYSNMTSMLMTMVMLFSIIWIRSIFPRMRYDEYMNICWKVIIPLMTVYVFMFWSISIIF